MKLLKTDTFQKCYDNLPENVKRKLERQIGCLAADYRHPSLQSKKIDSTRNIYQARIDRKYRFYYRIEEDCYVLLTAIPHPK